MNPSTKELIANVRFYSYKKRLHANAKRFLPKLDGDILDIGSGKQPFKPYLSHSGRYETLEIGPNSHPSLIGDIQNLGVASQSFDAVICTEVLEHIANPQQALENISRVLRPGGKLYMTVPMSWGLHYEPSDYYRYTKYGLHTLLQSAGLTATHTVQIGGLFVMILARLQDILVSLLYRVAFPLRWIVGNDNRYHFTSYCLLPLLWLLDLIATFLDKTVPRANEDALGWAILATKAGESANGSDA